MAEKTAENTQVQLSDAEFQSQMLAGLAGLASQVAGIGQRVGTLEASAATLPIAPTQVDAPEYVQAALLAREQDAALDAADDVAITAEATEDELLEGIPMRLLRVGEAVYGRAKESGARSGLAWEIGAIVTTFTDAGNAVKFRIWDGTHYRAQTQAWVEANVRKLKSLSRRLKGEQNGSANAAQEKALKQFAIANVQTWPAGSEVVVTPNPRTGHDALIAKFDKQSTIVSLGDVDTTTAPWSLKNDITRDRTHMPRKLRAQVKRHNVGECSCKPTWLCPAAQALGPNPVTIGATSYEGVFDGFAGMETAGATLVARVNKAAWSLEE